MRVLQFEFTWDGLTGRSTTMPEDIHGIMANMLDINAREILSLPWDQRMKALLHGIGCLPYRILCDPIPRLKSGDRRERWISSPPGVRE